MTILLLFAFISGLVTILAPCIWPLMPIILSTSINGTKAKSLGITLGIMVSFAVFTLTISYLVESLGLNPESLRVAAVVVLVFLGLAMIIPQLGKLMEIWVSRLSGRFNQTGTKRTGFFGGFITGAALGIVWTPCAGPILAAIATLAATSQVNFGIILVTVVYVVGVGIPLFFFSYGGQKLVSSTRSLNRYTGRIQQVFGIILLLTALSIYTSYDKFLQAKLLDLFPQYSTALIALESNDSVKKELDRLTGSEGIDNKTQESTTKNLPKIQAAPEIIGISNWLNSDPLTISGLKDKVVLIDFWTYTCINCIRTLPYVTSWYEKYKDDGLLVIGVHSPEFEFEKSTQNVANAIKQYNISYPVAQDNDFATWRNYSNRYWPAKYLIDKDGIIRYFHFGEGNYDETEKAIQELLKEKGESPKKEIVSFPNESPTDYVTPETYLGSSRISRFAVNEQITGDFQTFSKKFIIPQDSFAYLGEWKVASEYAESGKNASLELNFNAKKIFLVITPKKEGDTVNAYISGRKIEGDIAGTDVKNGIMTLDKERLYEILHLDRAQNSILRLEFPQGTKIYAFTFG